MDDTNPVIDTGCCHLCRSGQLHGFIGTLFEAAGRQRKHGSPRHGTMRAKRMNQRASTCCKPCDSGGFDPTRSVSFRGFLSRFSTLVSTDQKMP